MTSPLLCAAGEQPAGDALPSATEEAGGGGAAIDAGPQWKLGPRPSVWEVLREQFEPPPITSLPPVAPQLEPAPIRMTVREAVAAALRNNPGLLADSLNPVIQQQGILGAQAEFDPLLGVEPGLSRRSAPASSALSGVGGDEILKTHDVDWDAYFQKTLLSGGQFRLDFTNNRFTTNSVFQGLVPQYKPEVLVSLNQPLLRDFGLYFTRLKIRLAETATEQAVEDYKAAAADFVRRVVSAYWTLVLTAEQLEVRRDSLELARQTVRDNRTRVDVGVLPPVAVKESEAEAARREEEVIVAENNLVIARQTLQQLVYLPRPVEPVERPATERIAIDPEQALRTAVERRPEIHAARLTVKTSDLNVALYKNELLPKVNVVGAYGINALSGNPNPIEREEEIFLSRWGGTYGDALGRMFSGDFYSYEGSIRIEVPIGNAKAKSDYDESRAQREQALGLYRQKVADVTLDVAQAVADVQSNMKRIEATRVARELSEENLGNQTRRYEVGMTTTTDLLKFQNDVRDARLAENRALIDFNVSLASLERARGTLLDRFNVIIEPAGRTYTPWWAQF